ncbi:hypothetical protein ACFL27_25750, partial [candidate division CSSED10-310 bacterium]
RCPNGSGGLRNTDTYDMQLPTPGAENTCPVPEIVINEVDCDTPGDDPAETLEFIELYDGGIGNTPLDGFVVVLFNGDSDLSYAAYDLDGFFTNGDGYFVIGDAGVVGVDLIPSSFALDNGADAVALYLADDTDFPPDTAITPTDLIDALVYDTGQEDDGGLLVLLNAGQPQINENGNGFREGHSMQRCPDGSGGVLNTDTYDLSPPTPGVENVCNVTLPDIIINEVDASTPGDSAEFIELYDGGIGSSSLSGFSLVVFTGDSDNSYAAWDLDGFLTDADGYFVIGDSGVPNVDYAAPGFDLQDGADAVGLFVGDPPQFVGFAVTTNDLIDALVYDTDEADDAELLILLNAGQPQVNENGNGDAAGHSMQRCPNGSGGARNTDTYDMHPPTPGVDNVCSSVQPDVFINEVWYDDTDSDDEGFLELIGPPGADLTGFTLQEFDQNCALGSSLDLSGHTIPGDGYFVIGYAGGASVDLENTTWMNSLQNGPCDGVELQYNAVRVDALQWGTDCATEYTLCGEGDSAPEPLDDTNSLSRCPNGQDSDDNSVDFADTPPTIGAANECPAPPIVINEVWYNDPDTDDQGFVEIIGPPGFDLTGVTLQEFDQTCSLDAVLDLSGYTIPGDGYFVVGYSGTAEVDLIDDTWMNTLQNGPCDGIEMQYFASRVDAVQWGSGCAVICGETNPASEPGADANSLSRCPDGQDTDDNAVDFTETMPTPGQTNLCLSFDMVINEVWYDDFDTDDEGFVEISGPPGTDLTGFILQEFNESCVMDLCLDLSGYTIPGDGYFVVGFSGTINVDLIDDAWMAAIQDGPCDGIELQYSSFTIDAVRWGSFCSYSCGEGDSAAAAVLEAYSVGRCPDSQDTDDNNFDFTTGIASPGRTNRCTPPNDVDQDGLPDWWELYYFMTLVYGPDHDNDNDGYTNAEELANGTDPTVPDQPVPALTTGAFILLLILVGVMIRFSSRKTERLPQNPC